MLRGLLFLTETNNQWDFGPSEPSRERRVKVSVDQTSSIVYRTISSRKHRTICLSETEVPLPEVNRSMRSLFQSYREIKSPLHNCSSEPMSRFQYKTVVKRVIISIVRLELNRKQSKESTNVSTLLLLFYRKWPGISIFVPTPHFYFFFGLSLLTKKEGLE